MLLQDFLGQPLAIHGLFCCDFPMFSRHFKVTSCDVTLNGGPLGKNISLGKHDGFHSKHKHCKMTLFDTASDTFRRIRSERLQTSLPRMDDLFLKQVMMNQALT